VEKDGIRTDHQPTELMQPVGQIHILGIEEQPLIEPTDLLEYGPPDGEASPGEPRIIRLKPVLARTCPNLTHNRGSGYHFWGVQGRLEIVEATGLRVTVRVQEQDNGLVAFRCQLVRRSGEADIVTRVVSHPQPVVPSQPREHSVHPVSVRHYAHVHSNQVR
jgi:hypothetical protein